MNKIEENLTSFIMYLWSLYVIKRDFSIFYTCLLKPCLIYVQFKLTKKVHLENTKFIIVLMPITTAHNSRYLDKQI